MRRSPKVDLQQQPDWTSPPRVRQARQGVYRGIDNSASPFSGVIFFDSTRPWNQARRGPPPQGSPLLHPCILQLDRTGLVMSRGLPVWSRDQHPSNRIRPRSEVQSCPVLVKTCGPAPALKTNNLVAMAQWSFLADMGTPVLPCTTRVTCAAVSRSCAQSLSPACPGLARVALPVLGPGGCA